MKMGTGSRMGKKGFMLLSMFFGCLLLSSTLFAATVDLTVAGSSGYISGAYFTTTTQQTTGTGVIEPFLRLAANGSEKGYNTDGTLQYDTKSGLWTHSLLLSAIPEVTINGVIYREFLLDINESNTTADRYLSLDQIQIFTNTVANATGYPSLGTKIYDMDAGVTGDSVVLTNYALNPGSGGGDLFAYIPTARFGTDLTKYVYFYSEFGGLGLVSGKDWGSSDGFEEWAVRTVTPNNPVPEPGTMLLLGSGLVGLAGWGRKKFRK